MAYTFLSDIQGGGGQTNQGAVPQNPQYMGAPQSQYSAPPQGPAPQSQYSAQPQGPLPQPQYSAQPQGPVQPQGSPTPQQAQSQYWSRYGAPQYANPPGPVIPQSNTVNTPLGQARPQQPQTYYNVPRATGVITNPTGVGATGVITNPSGASGNGGTNSLVYVMVALFVIIAIILLIICKKIGVKPPA